MATPAQFGPRPAPGEDRITDTNAHAGEWAAILALADSVFSELVSKSMSLNAASISDEGQSHAGMTLSQGMLIRGIFTQITLTSGEVLAYKPPV